MSHVFDHGSNLKLVSAAGLAPAIPRFQAEHVAATPRADGVINRTVIFGGEIKSPLKSGLLSLTDDLLGVSAESSAGTGFGNNGTKTTGAVSSQTCKHKGLIPQGPEPVRSLHL